jgi:protoporphyrinogen oxidase
MKIAIIGAGFTGLSATLELLKKDHEVIVFEKEKIPGGLVLGFKESGWDWNLEQHYHHWFTNDKFILNLAKAVGQNVLIKRPKTSVYVNGKSFQFDSPKSVLLFPKLSLIERMRMGLAVGFLRYNPIWKPLEKINSASFLPKAMGEKGYRMIWEPLFKNKFGPYSNNISLAWFWARIIKRTPTLAYPEGGFLNFAKKITKEIEKKGGKVLLETEITELEEDDKILLTIKNKNGKTKKELFDKVIVTVPSTIFLQIAPSLPKDYRKSLGNLKSLGATNLILRLTKPFLADNTYWLNICDPNNPIMAVVEHTNFMDKKNYNNESLLYLGNYLPQDSKRFSMTKEETLKLFHPFLLKMNPNYKKNLIDYSLFKTPFAQSIILTNYSKLIPPFRTPMKNVFLANMEQVYPWDRGTNYAVEYGQKVVREIFTDV